MQRQSDREQILSQQFVICQQQQKQAKFEELSNMLRCKLCFGLLRFAHTLAECGHTFCQHCIFTYINGFKGRNPDVKCPQCHSTIEPVFHRSVIRDVFKQSIVDLLDPSFAIREKIIIDRIKKLFPQFNLSFLLDDFSFTAIQNQKRKRVEKSKIMNGLAVAVRDKLGMTFEAFSQQISEQEGFLKLLQKKLPEAQKTDITLNIRPRSIQDYRFVGVNNKIKTKNYSVGKIRKFLQKKMLLRLQSNEQLAKEIIDPDCISLTLKIAISFSDKLLQDNQKIDDLSQIDEEPIYYWLPR